MKVYIVMTGERSEGGSPVKPFKSKAKANRFAARMHERNVQGRHQYFENASEWEVEITYSKAGLFKGAVGCELTYVVGPFEVW
jgi:hypothetical protein